MKCKIKITGPSKERIREIMAQTALRVESEQDGHTFYYGTVRSASKAIKEAKEEAEKTGPVLFNKETHVLVWEAATLEPCLNS